MKVVPNKVRQYTAMTDLSPFLLLLTENNRSRDRECVVTNTLYMIRERKDCKLMISQRKVVEGPVNQFN